MPHCSLYNVAGEIIGYFIARTFLLDTEYSNIASLLDIFTDAQDGLHKVAELDVDVGVGYFHELRAVGNGPSVVNLMLPNSYCEDTIRKTTSSV